MENHSVFEDIPLAPPDSILSLVQEYKDDASKDKVDLGPGAYRDENGKPWVLPVVRKAEKMLLADPTADHEYLPIAGLQSFTKAAAKLVLGEDCKQLQDGLVVSMQTISGTGSLHLACLFMSRFYKKSKKIYISSPSWPNHYAVCRNVGLEVVDIPYYDPKTRGLDFNGYKNAIEHAEEGSIILLHACAHNPTGVDPTKEQWNELAPIFKKRNLFPFFDIAYQGFATGSLSDDNYSIRTFLKLGIEMSVCQSFAKNCGLYGERVGAFHLIAADKESTTKILSQLKVLQRSEISSPPAYGARIVDKILNDPVLFEEWTENLLVMSGRIKAMRKALYDELLRLKTPGSWNHIIDQIGMFSYTGLERYVKDLKQQYHVYMTSNGRISMSGLNEGNVKYFAQAIDKVVRGSAGKL
jgi:aspartate aminotransferase